MLFAAVALAGYVHPRYMHPDRPAGQHDQLGRPTPPSKVAMLQPEGKSIQPAILDVVASQPAVLDAVTHDAGSQKGWVPHGAASLRQALCPEVCEAVYDSSSENVTAAALSEADDDSSSENVTAVALSRENVTAAAPPLAVDLSSVPSSSVALPVIKRKGQIEPFWLPEGTLTQLLKWKSKKKCVFKGKHYSWSMVRLLGKTMSLPTTGNQWFDQFVVTVNGEPALEVSRVDGATVVKIGGREAPGKQWSVNGVEIMVLESESEGKRLLRKQRNRETNRFRKSSAGGEYSHKIGKTIVARAAGAEMHIFASADPDHLEGADRAKYTHLNVVFEGGLPKHGFGLFAELAGIQRMTNATRALLVPPHASNEMDASEANVSEANVVDPRVEANAAVVASLAQNGTASLPQNGTLAATLSPATSRLYAKAITLIHHARARSHKRQHRHRADRGVRGVSLMQHEAIAEKVTCVCPEEMREQAEKEAAEAAAAAEAAHAREEEAAMSMSNAMASADVEALEKAMKAAEEAAAASAAADKEAVTKQDAAMKLSGRSVDDVLTPAVKSEVAKAEAEKHSPPKELAGRPSATVFAGRPLAEQKADAIARDAVIPQNDNGQSDHGVSDQPPVRAKAQKLSLIDVAAMMAM